MLLYLSSAVCWLLRLRLIIDPDIKGCSGHGSLDACGHCVCDKNYFGNKCECYYPELMDWSPQNTSAAIARCTPDDLPNPGLCSGKGECFCGRCHCFPIDETHQDRRYYGQFCECEDFSCPYHNSLLCGENGRCVCGKCVCKSGFTGDACECPTSQDACRSSDGHICNGKGSCVCGKCECNAGSMYQGPTCEDCPPIVEESSDSCSNHGSLDSCGQCTCENGYTGEFCECHDGLSVQCINPNSTSGVACSGRGECLCGMCSCFPRRLHSQRYSGRYCQCDDYSCSYHNNLLCGGHGRCDCGDCRCDEGYEGEACECSRSTKTCLEEAGQICNNHGSCICGRCVCDPLSVYSGPFCDECPTCQGKCMHYQECIRCKVDGSGPYTAAECLEQCPKVTMVDVIDQNDRDSRLCFFTDDYDGLEFLFSYKYTEDNNIMLTAQTTRLASHN